MTALALLLSGCAAQTGSVGATPDLEPTSVELFDPVRRRPVPILLYGADRPKPLAVISHGYGGHAGDYSFIARELVRRGYVVASIEHLERPGDPPMVTSGNLAELRRPVWQIGADSIGFVIAELRRQERATDAKAVLVGHSNGGDMTMLFASERPADVLVAFSLDNRRLPVPRTAAPRVCSARSIDFPADAGVLPTEEERARFRMVISDVNAKHDNMWDGAIAGQRATILSVLDRCLSGLAKETTG